MFLMSYQAHQNNITQIAPSNAPDIKTNWQFFSCYHLQPSPLNLRPCHSPWALLIVVRTNNNLNQQYLSKSIATSKGHLQMQFQNLHSTKTKYESTTSTLHCPNSRIFTRTNNAFLTLIDNNARSYSDQTGRFPMTSSKGNKYVFILYDYDANALLATAIPNRQGNTICEAWTKTYKQLQ